MELDGQEIIYEGNVVGAFTIKRERPAFQCLTRPDGKANCGYFFQIQVDVSAEGLDKSTAKQLVFNALGAKRVDYLTIEERVPLESGGYEIPNFDGRVYIRRDRSLLL